MTDKKPRIWDDDCVDSDADGDITAKDAARKGLEAAQHARWMRKFGPNYMMVVESRRAKRKRAAAKKAREDERNRKRKEALTCDICGKELTTVGGLRAHKALDHSPPPKLKKAAGKKKTVTWDRHDRQLGPPIRGTLAWTIATGTFRK